MESIASLFCHIDDDIPGPEMQRELQRQYDLLAQQAVCTDRIIEHCFFHVGQFCLKKPDQVLLRFLQQAHAKNLGLVFTECKERFPLPQNASIPYLEIYFVQEGIQEGFGSNEIQVNEEPSHSTNMQMYWGF